MNEFPFPPPESLSQLTERYSARFVESGGHLAVILVALLALLLWQNRRPVSRLNLLLWLAVITLGASLLEADAFAKPFLMATGLTGLVCTVVRYVQPSPAVSPLVTIGSWLALSLVAVVFQPGVASARTAAVAPSAETTSNRSDSRFTTTNPDTGTCPRSHQTR